MTKQKYTDDGYLIVSELDRCPCFAKEETPAGLCSSDEDCFFCKFSDFRKMEYIRKLEDSPEKGVLYSVCHNENNRKDAL